LILDALIAAVLLTILGLTSSFFIQALEDLVFVLGRKPSFVRLGLGMLLVTLARAGAPGPRSTPFAHLNRRIHPAPVLAYHRYPQGLPLPVFASLQESSCG